MKTPDDREVREIRLCVASHSRMDETFRLNAPLTSFPETKFYPGRYRSAEDAFGKQLAVISPHRAQNAAIRAALASDPAGRNAVVETVDKIQGKERDAVIASYTVSDPEFALAEAEFIFSVERLNVTITQSGELPPLIDAPDEASTEPLPEFTKELEELLTAIRDIAVKSPFGTAADYEIKKKLIEHNDK